MFVNKANKWLSSKSLPPKSWWSICWLGWGNKAPAFLGSPLCWFESHQHLGKSEALPPRPGQPASQSNTRDSLYLFKCLTYINKLSSEIRMEWGDVALSETSLQCFCEELYFLFGLKFRNRGLGVGPDPIPGLTVQVTFYYLEKLPSVSWEPASMWGKRWFQEVHPG